jgi:polyvinyl alcohol dehydrogenase (cytochrome)
MLAGHNVRRFVMACSLITACGSGDDSGDGSAGPSGSGASGADAGTSNGGGGGSTGMSGSGGSHSTPSDGENVWAHMGYDARNWYFNPAETTLSVDNAATLTEKWRFPVSGYPPGSPVVAEGKVFVMATGGTYGIDLESGQQLWARADLGGTASVAHEPGFIYVHTMTADLYKLNSADGTTVWGPEKTYSLTSCDGTSSPVLGGGKVIVGHSCGLRELGDAAGSRGGVEAHNAETGAKEWTYWTVPETGEDGAMVWSSVAIDVASAVVFASTGNNYSTLGENSDSIHAIDLGAGTQRWKTQVRQGDLWSLRFNFGGPDTDFGANPILAEVAGTKIVAAGDKGSAFWALDRETGAILWSRTDLSSSHTPSNGGVLMNGAFDGKYFYVASNQPPNAAILHALDPMSSGADVWTNMYDKIVWGAPSLANGVLAVPVDTQLYILNAETGAELAKFETGGTIAAGAAAIVQGKVIVQSGLSYPLGTVVNNNLVICYGLP